MRRWWSVAIGIAVLAAATPAVQAAPTDAPWNAAAPYGMNTSFGWVGMEPRLVYRGDAIEVTVPMLIRSDPLVDHATRILFALNLHNDALHVELTSLQSNGTPLPIDRDERGANARKPQLVLVGLDVPRDVVIELSAVILAADVGEHHFGVMVIAFDPQWKTLETIQGDPAQLYGFSRVRSAMVPVDGWAAPVHGLGNTFAAFFLPGLLSGGVFLVGISAALARFIVVRRRAVAREPVRTG